MADIEEHDPIDDKPMPLLDHLMELRTRLIWSIVAFGVCFIGSYYFSNRIYFFLAEPLADVLREQGNPDPHLIYTQLYEAFFTRIKVAFFAGAFIAFPIIANQIWLFVAPGLYRSEKRALLPFLAATPVLFILGAALAYYFVEKALDEVRAGRTETWTPFKVPEEAISCGFTEAVRGVLSHHMVIRDGKIANYHPYPPTPWNANPRDSYGTPGPYEDAVQGQPIFEENDREHFKGIDIMRTVRSFDPCLPCGVHMYVGGGKTIDVVHSPMASVLGVDGL
jgi:hypothetical protein